MENKIIEECTNGANSNRLGKISYNNKTITNSDVLQSFSIDSSCYVDGIIGSVYSKNLKINLIENNTDISDQLLDVEIGIKFDEENTYIPMGKYKVDKVNNEVTMDKTEITAYDELYSNLDKKYECHINYNEKEETGEETEEKEEKIKKIYLKDLYLDVCNNLNLIPVTEDILNGNIIISNNPFTNNETNRTVLETISKIACSFVTIDNETNKIDLSWLSEEINYTFYTSDYTNVEKGITYGPINCLIIKNSQIDDENITRKDEEDIELNGEHSLIISEDYILYNVEERQNAIDAIWNRVKGLTYVDTKLTTYYGKPFLKLGDKIRIYTNETDYFDTYLLKHNFTFDGTFISTIESPVLTEQEIKTKQDVSLKEILKNTQITVDKQGSKIDLAIEKIDQDNKSIANISMNMHNIISTVSEVTEALENDYIKAEEVSNVIKQTKNDTTNLISQTGGSNLLKNTQFYQNADEWDKDENVSFEVITGNVDVEKNTTNKSELLLKNGTLSQEFSMIIGKEYTISFRYRKEGLNNRESKVRISQTDSGIDVLNETNNISSRKEFSYTFVASSSSAKVEIYTDNDNFWIDDFIIQSGTSTEWSSNITEVRGLGHKLSGSDLELYDLSNSGEKAILDYNNLTFYQNNTLKAEYGSNNMQVNNAKINQTLSVCGLTYTNIDDDNVIMN